MLYIHFVLWSKLFNMVTGQVVVMEMRTHIRGFVIIAIMQTFTVEENFCILVMGETISTFSQFHVY